METYRLPNCQNHCWIFASDQSDLDYSSGTLTPSPDLYRGSLTVAVVDVLAAVDDGTESD